MGHNSNGIKRTDFKTSRLSGKKVKKGAVATYFNRKWKAQTLKKHETQQQRQKSKPRAQRLRCKLR